jgi:hypothetical protein
MVTWIKAMFKQAQTHIQYFTKVGGISDFWCVWRAYACHTHQKSGFFKMFRELLTMAFDIAGTNHKIEGLNTYLSRHHGRARQEC